MLGLHQQHAIDGLVSVQGHGSSVFQHGDALYLLYCQAVDRTLHTVDKNQNIFLASGLDATDVERSTAAILTLESGVLVGIQAK